MYQGKASLKSDRWNPHLVVPLMIAIFIGSLVAPASNVHGQAAAAICAIQGQRDQPLAKIDPMLAQLYCEATGQATGSAAAVEGLTAVNDTQVRVEILAADGYEVDQTIADLEEMGGQAIKSYQRLIAVTIPITAIEQVRSLASVQFVRISSPAPREETSLSPEQIRTQFSQAIQSVQVGSVTGQHVALMDADDLQAAPYNLGGTGIKIGIISDSWNCYSTTGRTPTAAQDAATGDVPNSVNVIADWDDFGGDCNDVSDEIRAMLQVVYDIAPNATYAVASNGQTKVDMATVIDDLVTWGADVIANDVQFITEAMFQDDIITQAIDDAYAQGVAFFTLSHNHRDDSWEGAWASSDGDNWLDFAAGPDERWGFTPAGSRVRLILQWDQPYKSISGQNPTTDLWLGVYRTSDNVLWFSADWNNLTGDPYEWFWVNVTPGTQYYVSVWKNSGTDPGLVKLLFQNSGDVSTYSPNTTASTLYGNSMASGAITIGGVPYFDTTQQYYYNSRGVTPILFSPTGTRYGSPIYRNKPDIVSPTGLNNTFFGSDDTGFSGADTDTYPNFWGTSSSAPAAAGIGALLLDSNPNLTPAQLYDCLRTTANDVTSTGVGFDTNTGYGYIDSLEAYATCAALDYGDLPDTFDTLSSNGGPSHVTGSTLYLGSCADSESDGTPDAQAGVAGGGGDNIGVGASTIGSCAVANNDEDGVTLVTPLVAGEEACVAVDAANSTGGNATLYGWIDFNGDGDFDGDANEAITFTSGGTIANGGATDQQACFTVPSGATFDGGETHMRFRLTTDALNGATPWGGAASNGEVEDYYQQFACVGNFVWSDLDGDGVQDGSESGINGVGVNLVWAGSDDTFGTADDRTYSTTTANVGGVDGKYSFCGLSGEDSGGDGGSYRLEIATLPAGLDLTRSDAGGNDVADSDGTQPAGGGSSVVASFTIPNSMSLLTSENGTGDNPGGINGYPDSRDNLSFDIGFAGYDYGDLPDGDGTGTSYPTNNTDGGEGVAARHALDGVHYLGSCVDAEVNGQGSGTAVGDDGGSSTRIDGTACGDDEDGVVATGNWSDGTGDIVVDVAGGDACLNVWVDWGDGVTASATGNGSFEAAEHLLVNQAVTTGSGQPFAFALPSNGANNANWFMRVRLTPRDSGGSCTGADSYAAGAAAAGGTAYGGEVEDYTIAFQPLAVQLQKVSVQPAVGQPWLMWLMVSLVGLTGLALASWWWLGGRKTAVF